MNVAFPVNNKFTGVLWKCFGPNMRLRCVKNAPAVEFAKSTTVWFSSAILLVNLRVLETADVTVAMTFRKVGRMVDENSMFCSGEKCYFSRRNHRLKSRNVSQKRVKAEWILGQTFSKHVSMRYQEGRRAFVAAVADSNVVKYLKDDLFLIMYRSVKVAPTSTTLVFLSKWLISQAQFTLQSKNGCNPY